MVNGASGCFGAHAVVAVGSLAAIGRPTADDPNVQAFQERDLPRPLGKFRPRVSVNRTEPLARQGTAVHPIPAGQTVPGGPEAGMHLSGSRQHQQAFRSGESNIMLAGMIEVGDALRRLESEPIAVGGELPTHRVHVDVVEIQATHDHHVPLPAFGLMNGGNHDPAATARASMASGTGRRAVHRYAGPLQGVQVAHGRGPLHRVQQERHLFVLGYDPLALQEPHQVPQLLSLVPGVPAVHGDDRRIVPVRAGIVGRDGLRVAEGLTLRVGIGPVGGGGHPPAVETHDGRVAAVVDAERHGVAVTAALRELQEVPDAGPAETVDALVVVPHHADVAVAAGQPQQQGLLDEAGVLVLVEDQVTDAVGDRIGDAIVLEKLRRPPLQVVEVSLALIQEQVPVTEVAAAQGGVERIAGVDQLPRLDELVADPFEVLAAMSDHQVRLPPAPALPLQDVQVGAEDDVEMAHQEAPLIVLVQHRKVRPETSTAGVGAQDPAAQAMNGADAHPGQVSHAAGSGGQGDETLAQLTGRGAGVGAQHQLLRLCPTQQQNVRAPQRHRQGLAGAGTGDAQRGAIEVADEFQLALVQNRVLAQYGLRNARVVVHVVSLLGVVHRLGRVWGGKDGGFPASRKRGRQHAWSPTRRTRAAAGEYPSRSAYITPLSGRIRADKSPEPQVQLPGPDLQNVASAHRQG